MVIYNYRKGKTGTFPKNKKGCDRHKKEVKT